MDRVDLLLIEWKVFVIRADPGVSGESADFNFSIVL